MIARPKEKAFPDPAKVTGFIDFLEYVLVWYGPDSLTRREIVNRFRAIGRALEQEVPHRNRLAYARYLTEGLLQWIGPGLTPQETEQVLKGPLRNGGDLL